MQVPTDTTRKLLIAYYLATAAFMALDYLGGINVRLSFLQAMPAARVGYYGVCFFCLLLMVWRPTWTVFVSTFESLITIIGLIISMWSGLFMISAEIADNGRALVPWQAITNFILSGSVAYIGWFRGIRQLKSQYSGKIDDNFL